MRASLLLPKLVNEYILVMVDNFTKCMHKVLFTMKNTDAEPLLDYTRLFVNIYGLLQDLS